MSRAIANPVVHLELKTTNLSRACVFYTQLFDWRTETVRSSSGSYLLLDLGRDIQGGVVECDGDRPMWLPYVEVADIAAATDRGRLLGAEVALDPREGPAGWRSVLTVPGGGEVALWQPKR